MLKLTSIRQEEGGNYDNT